MRPQLLGFAIGAPAVLAAVTLAAIETAGIYRRTTPDATTFAEAILDGVESAYAFVRNGADPSAPIPVRDAELTGDATVQAPPVLIAVAAGDGNTLRMLLGAGAQLDGPLAKRALCLARRRGHDEVEQIVAQAAPSAVAADCSPPAGPARPPLVEPID